MTDAIHSANILYCISNHYLGFMACSIKSLVCNGGCEHYNIYILHDFMESSMMSALSKDFEQMVSFHFIQVPVELVERFPDCTPYSPVRYYRFLAPFLLPQELDRVLYLDADTIVINPLMSLYELDCHDNLIVACRQGHELLQKINDRRQQRHKPMIYLDPSVLLIQIQKYRQQLGVTDIQNCLKQKKLTNITPDQHLLTSLCGKQIEGVDPLYFNLNEKYFYRYNEGHKKKAITFDWVQRNTAIIHYLGNPKPGDPGYNGVFEPFYQALFRKPAAM